MIGRRLLMLTGAALALSVMPTAQAEPDNFFTDIFGANTALGDDLPKLFSGPLDVDTLLLLTFDVFSYNLAGQELPAGLAGLYGNDGLLQGVLDSDAHTATGLAMLANAVFPGMSDQSYGELADFSAQYLNVATSDLLADLSQGLGLSDGEVYGTGARLVEVLFPADASGALESVAMDIAQFIDAL